MTRDTPTLPAPLADHDILIGKQTLRALLGVAPATLDRMIRGNQVPQPIRLSPVTIRWRLATVRAWLAEREAAASVGSR
jgi:predicted DNA-binding transcriptional regulator AlpA